MAPGFDEAAAEKAAPTPRRGERPSEAGISKPVPS